MALHRVLGGAHGVGSARAHREVDPALVRVRIRVRVRVRIRVRVRVRDRLGDSQCQCPG